MRAFIALQLPEPALDVLARLQEGIPAGRVVAREALHLTLVFLGDVPAPALEELDRELARIRAPAFDLRFEGVGSFGAALPSVLFAAVRPDPALLALHGKVRAARRAAGLEGPRTRFRPHVTLARFPRAMAGGDLARLGAFQAAHAGWQPPPFRAFAFALVGSVLHPEGAQHDPLMTYPLVAP